jgi:hypothetical protein
MRLVPQVVVPLCGGNIDITMLGRVIERGCCQPRRRPPGKRGVRITPYGKVAHISYVRPATSFELLLTYGKVAHISYVRPATSFELLLTHIHRARQGSRRTGASCASR